MTPQNKLHVDLTEIGRIDVICKCGSVMTIPIPKDNLRDHFSCVGCNERLWEGEHDQTYLRVLGMMRSLSNWNRHAPNANFTVGFSLDASHVSPDKD